MKPARIIILNDRSKAFGGATSLALLSARLLAEAGFKTIFVTGDSGADAELPDDVELIALGEVPLLKRKMSAGIAKGVHNRAAHAFVSDLVEKLDEPNTVYHVHGWAQIFSPSIFAALAPVQDRVLIHAHDFFHACPNGTYFNFQKDEVCHLTPLSAKCIVTNCDKRNMAQKAFRVTRIIRKNQVLDFATTSAKLAVLHPFMSEWLKRAGIPRSKQRVIRNPVTPFLPQRVEAEANSDLFFIGRVVAEKGADLAAQAARIAGRQLRVIGDGPERAALAERYPEVIWEGWRSHAEIAQLMKDARGLIMPSRLPEPFGLVALEALQSGVPLIAFPDAFVALEAAELGCAFLAKSRSAHSLSEAISQLDRDELVEQASRTAFEQSGRLSCTPQSWCDEILKVYSEILQTADTGPIRKDRPMQFSRKRIGQKGDGEFGCEQQPGGHVL